MRINKYIAHAGVASRRKAEELIKQGLVTVNGQVVRELATIIKTGDQVEVEGTPIYNGKLSPSNRDWYLYPPGIFGLIFLNFAPHLSEVKREGLRFVWQ